MRAAAAARRSACKTPRRSQLVASSDTLVLCPLAPRRWRLLENRSEMLFDLFSKSLEVGLARAGPQVNDEIKCRQVLAAWVTTKDLSNLAFQAMPHDGIADFTAGGDPQPWRRAVVGVKMQGRQGTSPLATMAIASQEIRTTTQLVGAAQPLTFRRDEPSHRFGSAVRRRDACGLCDVDGRGSLVPGGSASGSGSRAFSYDGGCWAEKYASRH